MVPPRNYPACTAEAWISTQDHLPAVYVAGTFPSAEDTEMSQMCFLEETHK